MKTTLMIGASLLALATAPAWAQDAGPAGAPASGATTTAPASAAAQAAMLEAWSGPYGGVPPWDKVKSSLFPAAFAEGIELQRAEINTIAANPAPPTFENTIVPLQDAARPLNRAGLLFFGVLTQNLNTPDVQAVDKEWSPKLAAADDEITFNEPLFRRIEAVYNNRDRTNLTAEQKRLVERTYDSFVRQGAKLDAPGKTRLAQINQQLTSAFTEFGNRVLADEDTWTVLDSKADLVGLPESTQAAYAAAAAERKLPGKWAVVNTRSSVDPFLTFSTRRDLRERVWKKFKARGDNGGANDTNAVIAKIVKLRAERARLLGYPTHAHWRMDDTMAKDPKKALDLTMRVWRPAVQRVKEEVADMQAIAAKEGTKVTIEPWDYLYYAEKVRKAKYDLDQAQLKPYFEVNNMVKAAFWSAEQRYDITFTEITGQVPVFHSDVRVFEVKDKPSGAHRGLFYLDNFARANKRSGAWNIGYRGHETFKGKITPITANNNNFIKGAPGEPILISLDDARTLFHEFGHALHTLLSEVKYPGLSGTPRDYVEFPSQVNERWLLTPEVLDRFARHYQTGQPMPKALLEKVNQSNKFNQGYTTVEALSSTIVDMELHTRPDGVVDPDAFERETLQRIGMPREIAMRHRLPQFNHLFTSDAYSAGYYSYLWSDVMAADAWAAFEEAGAWDKATALRFRQNILANGNTVDRAEAYRAFRGRDPEVKALLQHRGFPAGAE